MNVHAFDLLGDTNQSTQDLVVKTLHGCQGGTLILADPNLLDNPTDPCSSLALSLLMQYHQHQVTRPHAVIFFVLAQACFRLPL